MAEEFRVLRPVEYHSQLVSKGKRADGRSLEDVRELKLETDAIRTAESSSLVKLGNTSLVCGCTIQVAVNNDKNNEDEETIKIKVELPPICSSPTGTTTHHTAQLLTRTLKNILEDSSCLDKKNFLSDDSYWSVDVEVICLNYDGCLLDAALIAVLSALKSLKINRDDSDDMMSQYLEFNTFPICSSFAVIGNKIICDPNLEEESVASSTFSIVIDTRTKRCCHISKIGGKPLSSWELSKCIELAKNRAEKLENVI